MLCVTYLFTLLLYLSKNEIAPAEKSAGAIVRTEAADQKSTASVKISLLSSGSLMGD